MITPLSSINLNYTTHEFQQRKGKNTIQVCNAGDTHVCKSSPTHRKTPTEIYYFKISLISTNYTNKHKVKQKSTTAIKQFLTSVRIDQSVQNFHKICRPISFYGIINHPSEFFNKVYQF